MMEEPFLLQINSGTEDALLFQKVQGGL